MAIPLVPKLLRAHLAELAENDERHNGRGRWEARDTELEIGVLPRAEGSARVRMGDTIVYAGVKLQIMVPYPDRPNQGGLMCSAEVRPVAGPNWEPGPPSPESIELGRVVDRGIRESGCIDVDNLCLIPGEKAWQVILDLFAISDDGNLFDAFALAGIAAMRTAMIPEERFEISGEDRPLNISKTPIMCSYHKVGGRFVYDADGREELGGDERIHITLGDDGHVHSLQKGLRGIFTAGEFTEIMEHAQSRCNELREMVSKVEEAG
ncbi:MAG: RNA-binding protein [Candidatus Thalassarchaeum betae]|uniref:RNA-binding protein n=1 Tax=Candidatus Thalassarchaeum betae TaxID=2599289 RepID=A0A2V3HSA7_9ARCH|nr:MAG: RNA-binding protein [Candidatus Thalassoarchaea betae]PXF26532.1 MAG: RNA-binding protein [Euryarchaeota archaeon]HIC50598.1 exosome complex protein Rrp42 [Candidatus Poseidoniales archaeon]